MAETQHPRGQLTQPMSTAEAIDVLRQLRTARARAGRSLVAWLWAGAILSVALAVVDMAAAGLAVILYGFLSAVAARIWWGRSRALRAATRASPPPARRGTVALTRGIRSPRSRIYVWWPDPFKAAPTERKPDVGFVGESPNPGLLSRRRSIVLHEAWIAQDPGILASSRWLIADAGVAFIHRRLLSEWFLRPAPRWIENLRPLGSQGPPPAAGPGSGEIEFPHGLLTSVVLRIPVGAVLTGPAWLGS